MEYTLKDKLLINKDFLNDLSTKSWQEIEHLQSQITNIENKPENADILKLLKSLLTSYYVFVGGLENLASDTPKISLDTNEIGVQNDYSLGDTDSLETGPEIDIVDSSEELFNIDEPHQTSIEPFEYFVDFDEPFGDPLTDADLYTL
jgi:hypothetical protein